MKGETRPRSEKKDKKGIRCIEFLLLFRAIEGLFRNRRLFPSNFVFDYHKRYVSFNIKLKKRETTSSTIAIKKRLEILVNLSLILILKLQKT